MDGTAGVTVQRRPSAAIVTIGTELVTGMRQDTNATEVSAAVTLAGHRVSEIVSVGDERDTLASTLGRLLRENDLVITTGGLGPTHDDVTREAAASALGVTLERSEAIVGFLEPIAAKNSDAEAVAQAFRQADVLPGARVLMPVTGTAPGQVVSANGHTLALLPGPPSEMRPMLAEVLGAARVTSPPISLGVSGMSESDAQVAAAHAISGISGVSLTVLATPGDVRVVLLDDGGGAAGLQEAAGAVRSALAGSVYGTGTLAEAVLDAARDAGATLGVAESCTGGLVAARLTDVPGASDVFLGGVTAYSNDAKSGLLGVDEGLIEAHGAVSEPVALAMALGALERLGADVSVSVTGIAGPGGATPDKPVGLVWFATADARGATADARAVSRVLPGDRERVRVRAATIALGMLRERLSER